MADVIGKRLKDLIEVRRTTQTATALAIGLTQPTVGRLIDGTTRETGKLLELAAFLKTTPEYLVGWHNDRDADTATAGSVQSPDSRVEAMRAPYGAPDRSMPGMVFVKEIDLTLGLGGAFLDVPIEERSIPFPEDWLRRFSRAPVDKLVFLRGRGESMKPTVLDGDICLIDLARTQLNEQDELWAIAYGEIGMIKRLRARPDGTVHILSDNAVVPDEIASDGEMHILGRCCGVFRKT